MTFRDTPRVWPLPPLTELLYGPIPPIGAAAVLHSGSPAPFRPRRLLFPVYDLMAMTASTEGSIPARQTPPIQARVTELGTDRPPAEPSTDEPEADPDDLHRLVVEHGDAIYRLALSVVRDPSLAEDVAQETLVKAWLALPSFRGDASLRSWLLRIAHNTAISTLRRRRAVVLDPHDLPEEQSVVERSVESRVQGEVVMDQFVEALDLLDELSRSIVVLRELEGLSYEEISDVLSVPMPTVKTRLLRARRRLGNALREWA